MFAKKSSNVIVKPQPQPQYDIPPLDLGPNAADAYTHEKIKEIELQFELEL